jgi:hypothetical protein
VIEKCVKSFPLDNSSWKSNKKEKIRKKKREEKIEKEKKNENKENDEIKEEILWQSSRNVEVVECKERKREWVELFEKSCYIIALLSVRHLCLSRKTKFHLEPSHVTT